MSEFAGFLNWMDSRMKPFDHLEDDIFYRIARDKVDEYNYLTGTKLNLYDAVDAWIDHRNTKQTQ